MIGYNTWIVLLGTGLLGANAGLVGSFAFLRRRALTGDALAHAALPGLCLAFLAVGQRSLPIMLLGALLSGLLGIGCISAITRHSRVKEDAGIGIVLSVFFAAGIVLSRWIQNTSTEGSKAGLDSFILGKTAGMIASDVYVIGSTCLASLVLIVLLYKELKLVSFDSDFASVQGWPAWGLEYLGMGLMAVAVVVGLPAVGVVLMAALLILPGASARFWTESLGKMLVISAGLGLLTGLIGTAASAQFSGLPAGPIIVLVGTSLFLLSMLLAPRRGVLARLRRHWIFQAELARRQLLRTAFELNEAKGSEPGDLTLDDLAFRSGRSRTSVRRLVRSAAAGGQIESTSPTTVRLTSQGRDQAARIVRDLRMWELALLDQPEWAQSVAQFAHDSPADRLPSHVVENLEQRLRSLGRWPTGSRSIGVQG